MNELDIEYELLEGKPNFVDRVGFWVARQRRAGRTPFFIGAGLASLLLVLLGLWKYSTSPRTFLQNTKKCIVEGVFGPDVKAESLWPVFQSTSVFPPRFAYAFYATQKEYLCNTLINFEQLRQEKVAAEIGLIYPSSWQESDPEGSTGAIRRMLDKANKKYGVNLHPLGLWKTHRGDPAWSESLTKLHVFGLTDYERIIYLDSDGLALRNMDHLFLAPQARIALPRAYWLDKGQLASHIMIITPSDALLSRVKKWVDNIDKQGFDMELVNSLSASSALVLPHRGYAMLTGEFRNSNHSKYLAEDGPEASWDPRAELSRSFYIHFSDWPPPKPWISATKYQIEQTQPACNPEERETCGNRKHWQSVYDLYHKLKDRVCILCTMLRICSHLGQHLAKGRLHCPATNVEFAFFCTPSIPTPPFA
ncbi:hypothetical protein NLJ89_g1690 [Agrocybe chaxingu]|uniref:Nucleotide-diphospho-sugar transferase n=1 Tax=Agrocybe chaxingu TaxID=84603 RepID=A0A9W8TET3_9AGAR|nr:hypothetical protein NLJ89_g1690 [Agrocybe chaxingu]